MLDAKLRAAGSPGLEYHVLPLALAGIAGAILGVSVIIPLRKQMIEFDRLRFPSGVATATIIRAGSSGSQKAVLLAVGVLISAVWKYLLDSGVLETTAAQLALERRGDPRRRVAFRLERDPGLLCAGDQPLADEHGGRTAGGPRGVALLPGRGTGLVVRLADRRRLDWVPTGGSGRHASMAKCCVRWASAC